MAMIVSALRGSPASTSEVEVVERKGLGHPDTICDALAEQLSVALCQFYLERFGLILHHNVDKALLWGGAALAAFGGGEVIEPIEVFLAGRATLAVKGARVPIEELAEEACRQWLRSHFPALDPDRHVKIHCLIRPGSPDLVDLYMRQDRTGVWLANDTSCGVGYAPLTALEKAVLAVETQLNALTTKTLYPAIGQDIKVMGIRTAADIKLTLGCAMIDKHLGNLSDYLVAKGKAAELASNAARQLLEREVAVAVNMADDLSAGSVYLTVTGTSAEAGDDGQAGRGNRANGLITPYRPMTMESVAGKNPVTHVGKLYNVAATIMATRLIEELPELSDAQCLLVSQIGKPVAEPQLVDVKVCTQEARPVTELVPRIQEIVQTELQGINSLWHKAISGSLRLY
jgi:S-adenosylmethionine synthetase